MAHRSENRCVLKHISNIKFTLRPFWAVGAVEKKIQTAISNATFEGSFFMFSCAKKHSEKLYMYFKAEKMAIFA